MPHSFHKALFLLFSLGLLSQAKAENLAELLSGKLVRLEGNQLVDAGPESLQGKTLIAVYYSASWCPGCRQFTPMLNRYFNERKADHPELAIILVSSDRSAREMSKYMSSHEMPFLALKFPEIKNSFLTKHAAAGIPYLIVLDAEGKVLIEKEPGENWLNPGIALGRLEYLLKG
ncbi:MAG: thioredoxin-like domain-containing protein [Puniceicoccaceae bacterium]